ncbi:MAG: hypothetical protein R3E08_05300 [Thiotrichaceae bacterium]
MIFLHQVKEGLANQSYGLQVALLCWSAAYRGRNRHNCV